MTSHFLTLVNYRLNQLKCSSFPIIQTTKIVTLLSHFKQNRTISSVYNNFYSFSFTLSAIYVSLTTQSKKLSPWVNFFFFF